MKHAMIAVGALAMGVPCAALAKSTPPPPQPAEQPDWAIVRQQSEAALKSTLFDPSSAKIRWLGGFKWGYYKPLLSAKVWGWVACGGINAKNRMGGYVGEQAFAVVYDHGVKTVDIDQPDSFHLIAAGCTPANFPPPQPALVETAPGASAGRADSVADEIAKLAALRDKGILTEQEFQAQKAKVLGEAPN
ncbi:MAG: SHOCT domain-containing protein [Sphingomonadales bacterium]|nr:SHOCT domain-containing protein [Sphingomonadales bacterium]